MEIRPPNLDHLRNWKKVKMVLVSYLESLHFSFIHSFPVLRIRTEKKKKTTQPNPMTTIIKTNQPSKNHQTYGLSLCHLENVERMVLLLGNSVFVR